MALAVTLVPAQAGSGDRKICSYNRGNTPSGVPEGKPESQSQGRCSPALVPSIPLFSSAHTWFLSCEQRGLGFNIGMCYPEGPWLFTLGFFTGKMLKWFFNMQIDWMKWLKRMLLLLSWIRIEIWLCIIFLNIFSTKCLAFQSVKW